jgi:hypothetical protein
MNKCVLAINNNLERLTNTQVSKKTTNGSLQQSPTMYNFACVVFSLVMDISKSHTYIYVHKYKYIIIFIFVLKL